jgi:hypothetical protein
LFIEVVRVRTSISQPISSALTAKARALDDQRIYWIDFTTEQSIMLAMLNKSELRRTVRPVPVECDMHGVGMLQLCRSPLPTRGLADLTGLTRWIPTGENNFNFKFLL